MSDIQALDAAGLSDIPYTVEILGAPNCVDKWMRQSSRLLSLRDRPPASQRALERRGIGDVNRSTMSWDRRAIILAMSLQSTTSDETLADQGILLRKDY